MLHWYNPPPAATQAGAVVVSSYAIGGVGVAGQDAAAKQARAAASLASGLTTLEAVNARSVPAFFLSVISQPCSKGIIGVTNSVDCACASSASNNTRWVCFDDFSAKWIVTQRWVWKEPHEDLHAAQQVFS